jgi:DDE superfamily endonuclease
VRGNSPAPFGTGERPRGPTYRYHSLDKKQKAEQASLLSNCEKIREKLHLPKGIIHILRHFEEIFSERVWEWAKVLVIGAILAPGERTVTAILRVIGLLHEQQFQNYHRVLNRAKWSIGKSF